MPIQTAPDEPELPNEPKRNGNILAMRSYWPKSVPGLVVVAPRWSEGHFEMAMAALHSGAHVLTEKPFTVTLAQADEPPGRRETKRAQD